MMKNSVLELNQYPSIYNLPLRNTCHQILCEMLSCEASECTQSIGKPRPRVVVVSNAMDGILNGICPFLTKSAFREAA